MQRVVVCPFIGQRYKAPCPVCVFGLTLAHTDGDALRLAKKLLYKECFAGHGFAVCMDRRWADETRMPYAGCVATSAPEECMPYDSDDWNSEEGGALDVL